MQGKPTRERGKDGKFTAIKDNIEETIDLFYLFVKSIPLLLVILFALNYFGLWDALKKTTTFIVNIGNPNCRVVCVNVGGDNVN